MIDLRRDGRTREAEAIKEGLHRMSGKQAAEQDECQAVSGLYNPDPLTVLKECAATARSQVKLNAKHGEEFKQRSERAFKQAADCAETAERCEKLLKMAKEAGF